jgi:sortase A
MRRRAGIALIVALLGSGLWLLGHGLWIPAKARLAQHLLQQAWARTLAGESAVRPWPWADTWPVARLRLPAHGVDLIVLDGVSGRTLAFGPGHMPGTPLPGGGGVAVIAGHRDTHFRFLRDVQAGDEIVVEVPGRPRARFRVRARSVVDARTAVVAAASDAREVVLVTCYPFDALRRGGPLRYIVLAEAERG